MGNSRSLMGLFKLVRGVKDEKLFKFRASREIQGTLKLSTLYYSYLIAVNTQLFSRYSLEYLQGFPGGYRGLSEKYGVSEKVLQNAVYREVKAYYELIGIDVYKTLLEGDLSDEELELLYADLVHIYNSLEKREKDIRDFLYIDIISGRDIEGKEFEFSDSEFLDLREKIVRISKSATEFILGNIEEEKLDYVKYLLTVEESEMSEADKERRENLILFMQIEDFYNNGR